MVAQFLFLEFIQESKVEITLELAGVARKQCQKLRRKKEREGEREEGKTKLRMGAKARRSNERVKCSQGKGSSEN